MGRKRIKSKYRRVIDIGIYCIAVIFLFFAVILLLQEIEYIPEEVYHDPPPPMPAATPTVLPVQTTAPVPTQATYTPLPTASAETEPKETLSESTSQPVRTAAIETPKRTETPIFDESALHPVKLYFINQKISCEIMPVGLTGKNKMDTIRSAHKAGWLCVEPYVLPGDTGKAIIAGHNRWGGKNGTFSVLKKLKVGEQVAVEMSDGYARYFRVDEVSECAYNDNSVMEPVYDRAVLILITCKGDWSNALHTSKTRVLVTCSPIA